MTTSNIELTNEADTDAEADHDHEAKKAEEREENLFTLDKIQKTLKPLYFSLRCFGLAYEGDFQVHYLKANAIEPGNNNSNANDMEAQSQVKPRRQPRCHPGRCYCIFLSLLMWYQVILSSINFFTAKSFLDIMQFAVPFLWMKLCASQQLLFFRATCTSKKLSKFGKLLKKLVLVRADDLNGTVRYIQVIVLVAWISYINNVVTVFLGLIGQDDASGENEFQKILLGRWKEKHLTIITYIYLPIHAIFSGVWLFSTAFYVAMCYLVAKRFDDVFNRASAAISLKKNVDFATLRKEHVQLCHVVSALDDILSPLGLLCYVIYIPMTCVSLNVAIMTFEKASTISRAMYIFWLISNVVILFLVSVSGALVSHKAYSLSEVIYDVNAEELDRKNEREMMLLISHLNSNSTGLTVGGLTTITKGMVITVFGTVIGYFTILIQFQA